MRVCLCACRQVCSTVGGITNQIHIAFFYTSTNNVYDASFIWQRLNRRNLVQTSATALNYHFVGTCSTFRNLTTKSYKYRPNQKPSLTSIATHCRPSSHKCSTPCFKHGIVLSLSLSLPPSFITFILILPQF